MGKWGGFIFLSGTAFCTPARAQQQQSPRPKHTRAFSFTHAQINCVAHHKKFTLSSGYIYEEPDLITSKHDIVKGVEQMEQQHEDGAAQRQVAAEDAHEPVQPQQEQQEQEQQEQQQQEQQQQEHEEQQHEEPEQEQEQEQEEEPPPPPPLTPLVQVEAPRIVAVGTTSAQVAWVNASLSLPETDDPRQWEVQARHTYAVSQALELQQVKITAPPLGELDLVEEATRKVVDAEWKTIYDASSTGSAEVRVWACLGGSAKRTATKAVCARCCCCCCCRRTQCMFNTRTMPSAFSARPLNTHTQTTHKLPPS
jgi:hypothetical protein